MSAAAPAKEQTPPQQEVVPTPVADENDVYSDYDDGSVASSTQSMSSSMLEMVHENGRRYHRKSEGKYALPSDETEQDRLDLVHHLMLTLLGGELHSTKLDGSPANVLDCGTGTGIWALDFGEIHPSSNVLGVDLMPIQPSWVYPNVHFETDDLEKPWTFSHKFDFIHSRMLQTSIKDWDNYASQILKALNPGGRVELCEHILKTVHCDDGTGDESSALIKYMEVFREAMKKLGAHPDLQGEDLGEVLKKAGFVDVEVKTYKIAMGHWPKVKKDKRLGAMFGEVLRTGIDAYGMQVMTGLMGMTREEAEKMCNEARDVVLKSKEHWYAHFWTISGRKPAAGEA